MNNKYQEALCKIVNKLPAIEKALCDDDIILLEDLCDKEKPMKVTEKLGTPVSYEQYRKCPKCKDAVARMHSYCPFCGQKLDWSEE